MANDAGLKERLLAYMTSRPSEKFHGYELIKNAKVQSGTLYPQLARWEAQGWITHAWQERPNGKPPRRYYRLTGDGAVAARLELAAIRAARRAAETQRLAGAPKPAIGGAGPKIGG